LEQILFRGFNNVFNRRATGFHRRGKLFYLNFVIRKKLSSNQAGKIFLTADQFGRCPALNETPVLVQVM